MMLMFASSIGTKLPLKNAYVLVWLTVVSSQSAPARSLPTILHVLLAKPNTFSNDRAPVGVWFEHEVLFVGLGCAGVVFVAFQHGAKLIEGIRVGRLYLRGSAQLGLGFRHL